jgi:hypothetical protein
MKQKRLQPQTVALALLLALSVASGASAATFRVDDTGTLPQDLTVLMRWAQPAPSRKPNAGANLMVGTASIRVHLNVAPWLNRRGRIFMVLPESAAGRVSAQWTTQGRFLDGHGDSGQRVLIYAGLITTPQLEETINLQLSADAARMQGATKLQFNFEIDTDQ